MEQALKKNSAQPVSRSAKIGAIAPTQVRLVISPQKSSNPPRWIQLFAQNQDFEQIEDAQMKTEILMKMDSPSSIRLITKYFV